MHHRKRDVRIYGLGQGREDFFPYRHLTYTFNYDYAQSWLFVSLFDNWDVKRGQFCPGLTNICQFYLNDEAGSGKKPEEIGLAIPKSSGLALKLEPLAVNRQGEGLRYFLLEGQAQGLGSSWPRLRDECRLCRKRFGPIHLSIL